MVGKSGDRIGTGRFEPVLPDEELIAALCENDSQKAALILREQDSIGRYALDALADMIEGGVAVRARTQGPPVVLKIVAARPPGRPRQGEVRNAVSWLSRSRKTPVKSSGWGYMMALRVQRFIDEGMTRTKAIEAARLYRPFADTEQKKQVPPSFSAVEKAYDRYRKKLRAAKFKRTPRVLK